MASNRGQSPFQAVESSALERLRDLEKTKVDKTTKVGNV